MTTFTVDIKDQAQLDGLSAERERYNANNPQNVQPDDATFFAFLAASWFAQYAASKTDKDLADAVAAAKQGDPSMLKQVADAMATSAKAEPASPAEPAVRLRHKK